MRYLRFVLLGLLALVALAVIGLLHWGLPAHAGPGDVTLVAIDTDITGNTATSLGTREHCVSVDAGDTFEFDVIVSDVDDLVAWELYLTFDPSIVDIVDADMDMFLASNPRSRLIKKWEPVSDGQHFLGAADRSLLGESGSGVLARLTLQAKAPGFSHIDIPSIDFDGDGDIDKGPRLTDSQGNAIGDMTGDAVFDGPTFNAIVAVDRACQTVHIDIKPGSDPNSINLACHGVIPVAILTNGAVDGATVDPATVLFEGAAAKHWALEDVDGDGDIDMILHFKCQEVSIEPDADEACLDGSTGDQQAFEACDSVRIVPPDSPADSDGDGFTDAAEICMGTDLLDACPDTSDPNDEVDDRWPADLNDDQVCDIEDITQLTAPYFNTFPPDPNYSERKDFNGDGVIDIEDVTRLTPPTFNQVCT